MSRTATGEMSTPSAVTPRLTIAIVSRPSLQPVSSMGPVQRVTRPQLPGERHRSMGNLIRSPQRDPLAGGQLQAARHTELPRRERRALPTPVPPLATARS